MVQSLKHSIAIHAQDIQDNKENIINKHPFKLTAVTACVLLVAACGGGGSSTATAPPESVTPTPTPVVEVSTLIPAPQAAVYATDATVGPNSQRKAMFDFVNAERTRCGFGAVNQNAVLDKAALNHAGYLGINGTSGHNEAAGVVGFTGATPQDQINYAGGYQGAWGQVADGFIYSGVDSVRALMLAPYHAKIIFGRYTEIGLGYSVYPGPNGNSAYAAGKFVANFGSAAGSQDMEGEAMATYPCDAATAMHATFSDEIPSPGFAYTGTPIWMQIHEGHVLNVTAYTITKAVSGALPEPILIVMTDANNPNAATEPLGVNTARIVPANRLALGATYNVHVEWTNNGAAKDSKGVAYKRDFQFVTETYDYDTSTLGK